MVHRVEKSELQEVAKLMIQELSKEPFEEKEDRDAVIKSLEYHCGSKYAPLTTRKEALTIT